MAGLIHLFTSLRSSVAVYHPISATPPLPHRPAASLPRCGKERTEKEIRLNGMESIMLDVTNESIVVSDVLDWNKEVSVDGDEILFGS